MPSSSSPVKIWSIVFISIAAAMLAVFWRFTCDDAYIVMRYAENWVREGQLTYNLNEYVLAITSPLQVFIEALLFRFFNHTELSYKIFCTMVFLTISAGLVWFLNHKRLNAVFAGLFITSPFFILWTLGGLETPLLGFWLTLITWLFLKLSDEGSDTRFILSISFALALGFAFLTRYDSILFTLPLGLEILRLKSRERFTKKVLWILVSALLPLAWLAISYSWYGDVFPTSFYVKTPGDSSGSIVRGFITMVDFAIYSGLAWILIYLGLALPGRRLGLFTNQHRALAISFILYFLIYGSLSGAHHMMFSYRLFVPILPPFVLVLADWLSEMRKTHGEMFHTISTRLSYLTLLVVCLNLTNFVVIQFGSIHPARVGEYQNVSAAEYRTDFMDLVIPASEAIKNDWKAFGENRPPRIYTFVGGWLPYQVPNAYIVEQLVSFRHDCHPKDFSEFVDYIHLFRSARDLETTIAELEGGDFEVLWKKQSQFPGCGECGVSWLVFKRKASAPKPKPIPYPSRTFGPCRKEDRAGELRH